ncbi:glutamyl-tRNA(Gln) amidotransferase subunit C, chloroplastic/mitochondrial [Abrus precatorius]|uniref:Glutamyl-tRNA(Gln) amidotransferase subunit C, chloroplastic/mitochondrial n=1 Tax=Abrus precatorius TaxID=3816 RepID=A0A8B8MGS7_ABRPR|nr:glutamyl-tRNA(Gln) amidotransferase subunit C, chloroplastic/mitochondrial [Abrus precatorius]
MGSKGLLRGASLSLARATANAVWHRNSFFPTLTVSVSRKLFEFRSFSSTTTRSSLQPPDVSRLAKTAQISLTPDEVEEIAPKIQQVIDWFGQLQGVDVQSVEPSIRAETENNLRDNVPETFEHRDAMIDSVPSYEESYIKVPRVLSMD